MKQNPDTVGFLHTVVSSVQGCQWRMNWYFIKIPIGGIANKVIEYSLEGGVASEMQYSNFWLVT